MLCFSSVFLSLDLYYIIWVVSFKFKMPSEYSTEIITALIGLPIKMKKRFQSSEPASQPQSNKKGEKPIKGALGQIERQESNNVDKPP
jgi:hypothetical protein